MRRALPVLVSLLAGAMLFQAGGASLRTGGHLQPATIPVERLEGAFPDALLAAVPAEPAAEAVEAEEVSVVPPECRPPRLGSVCRAYEVAGRGVLRAPAPAPLDPYDLVPDRVGSVEDWRPLLSFFFRPGDVDRALRIVRCESNGDPEARNRRTSASGLFQHLGRYWPRRAVEAGFPGASVFDPVANTAAAALLVYEGGGWSHWTCR